MPELCEKAMLPSVQTCLPTDSATRAAVIMRDSGLSVVPVTDEGNHVIGVVTDRDLALRVLARNLSAATPLREIMTRHDLVSVSPADTVQTARGRMTDAHVHHVLVVDPHNKLLGVIASDRPARPEPGQEPAFGPGAAPHGSSSPEPKWRPGATAGRQA